MEGTTDSLRALATDWSLAADETLLNVFKTTHQKIVSKCQEVNTKLEEMVSALDDASINLQNVNNKFMALSNSQFIESRVYDDDGDLINEEIPVPPPPQPQPVPVQRDELTLLKQSLHIIDNAHETAEIIDESDSDSSDVEISVVLKPKDAYSHRPLPYIIGSQSWKNKWHAGLVIDDSDTDSTTSRQDINVEQYSESDDDIRTDRLMPHNLSTNISNSSSSLHSIPKDAPEKRTPAAVAAELQARLGAAPPPVQAYEEPEYLPPLPANKTVYRPQKPVTSTIFLDEPPPLDHQYPEPDSQEEDDIFAEINKNQPYNSSSPNNLDDLFGTITDEYSDSGKKTVEKSAKQKTALFDEEPEPELFAEKPKNIPKEIHINKVENSESTSKKPVGGISLFGSNKGTESIGAAILQRNRRKSSSTESDEGKNTIKNDAADEKSFNSDDDSDMNNANAIFDNLFAKAKQAEQKLMKNAKFDKPFINKPIKEKAQPAKEKAPLVKEKSLPVKEKLKPVNDIFSDSIFDDIDDIFNDIKIPSKEASKNAKSIFDDDDDDLFADVTKNDKNVVKNTETNSMATTSHNKSIFDSDDDLFGDVKTTNEAKTKETTKIESQGKITKENNDKTKDMKPGVKEPMFTRPESKELKPKIKTKNIFDSDSDDEIFASVKTKTTYSKEETNTSINVNTETETLLKDKKDTKNKEKLKPSEKQVFQSPALFEEDEIDDLFINDNKAKEKTLEINNIGEIVPEYLPDLKQVSKEDRDFGDTNEYNSQKIAESAYVNIKNAEMIDPNGSKSRKDKTESALFDNLEENLFTNPQPSESRKTEELVSTDDIIETSQEEVNVPGNSGSTRVAVKSSLEEQDKKENTGSENFETETQGEIEKGIIAIAKSIEQAQTREPAKVKQPLIPDQKQPILSPAFDDIFNEPPAFEKTKESKKITNVNALFEDDSDDESLFFKKNDIVSDEKPEIFSPTADFGIFADEPPELDIDFTSKGNKNDNDDDLFSSVPKAAKPTLIRNETTDVDDWGDDFGKIKTIKETVKPENTVVEVDDELFGVSTPSNVKEASTVEVPTAVNNINIPDSDEEFFSNTLKVPARSTKESTETTKDIDQVDEIVKTNEVAETKKIGKINTKNFTINVKALVPGASPKKIAKEQSTEDNVINNTSKEQLIANVKEYTEVDNTEPVIVKSETFESKPESGVLDNKLSKQRAKIQVKRRPSTRRARHEAARKSVINIDDDDTDNSSSIDDLKQNNHENKTSHQASKDEPIVKDSTSTENVNVKETVKKTDLFGTITGENSKTQDLNEQNINKTTPGEDKINIHNGITGHLKSHKSTDEIDSNEKKNDDPTKVAGLLSPQRTTKVKYILNDEDIFKTNDNTTSSTEKTGEGGIAERTNNSTKEEIDRKPNQDQKINTSSSKEVSKPAQPKAKSLFDLSDDDDDLFGKNTKKKVEVKSKLFDSDSEDELFSGKKDKKVKAKVKGSLFSDNDDDDLFGVKTKTVAAKAGTSKIPSKPATPRNVAKSSESTEIAFEDPLSMLDD